MVKKMSTDEFIRRARIVHGDKYDYSKSDCENRDNKGRVCIICHKLDGDGNEHGEFWQRPNSHIRGDGCRKCSNENTSRINSRKQSKTREEFITDANNVHHGKYSYDKTIYVNSHTKITITCPIHGDFTQTPTNHLQGKGCPKCANKEVTRDEFVEKAKLVHGDFYDYSKTNYTNNNTSVIITCPIHGDFEQKPKYHLQGKGCNLCGLTRQVEKRCGTSEEFISRAKLIHGETYDYSNVNYVNSHTLVEILCRKHGPFKQIPYVHLYGCGCRICGKSSSNPENEIYDYIIGLIDTCEVVRNNRKLLDGHEIDIYIPSLKIGFEYDGLYWHSEAEGKFKDYHISKTENANSKGIRLIHIFEDEWLEHKEIILNKIKHIIGKDSASVIGARKCSVTVISNDNAKQFLERYHIQGYANSTLYYGAFYSGELVGVMSFLKEHDGNWNLTRFATNFKYRLPGLANKILKNFIVDNNPNEIKTFLDRRWGTAQDNVYTKMGFKLVDTLKPDYSYIKGHTRYHKFGFRKQILHKKYGLPLTMTEKQMCDKLGFYRIWNCGLFKYVWKKHSTEFN